jgi:2-polyprenyl-3-methyl-5-hydroxy-6-metoxy-1,4-benzoquinol methylase
MTDRWETEYRAGRWAYLKGLKEAGRYGVIGAYLRHTMRPGALLDVGCGEAILAGYLDRAQATRYIGVDIAQAALDLAALDRAWGTLVCSPLERYAPAAGERFGAIVFNEVLFFAEQPGAELARYRAWLEPDGVAIVSMYQTPRPDSGARRSVEAVWQALDGPGWTTLDETSLTNLTKQLTWRIRLVRAV